MIRHGESTANVAREQADASGAEVIDIEARDADVTLSELGSLQARAIGRELQRGWPDGVTVWSSPYQRAIMTAQLALAESTMPEPILVDERLRDRELGVLDLLTARGVRARHPEEADRRRRLGKFYYRPPGGESWTDVALRLRSFLASLTGDAIIFTHDAVVTMTRYVCCGITEREVLDLAAANPIGNASISRFSQDARGRWHVLEYNAQDHLVREQGLDLRTVHPGEPDVHPR